MTTNHQHHRRTDGETDVKLAPAIPQFALRTSRGKMLEYIIYHRVSVFVIFVTGRQ